VFEASGALWDEDELALASTGLESVVCDGLLGADPAVDVGAKRAGLDERRESVEDVAAGLYEDAVQGDVAAIGSSESPVNSTTVPA
jgi:hypothetical protein